MTQPNLFRPPEAVTADIRPELPRGRRPISAWLLEAFLVFMILAWAAGAWRAGWSIALDWQQVRSPVGAIAAIAYRMGGIVVFATTLRGVHGGRAWARWLGLAILVAVLIFSIVRHDNAVYPNDAQRAGADLAGTLLPVFIAWWSWAFAFSAKARRYFGPRPEGVA